MSTETEADLRRALIQLHDRALRAEAAVPVWVPTVERLPALHEDVLIAWHYSGHPRVDAAFLTDGNDWITGDMVVATHDVTHWMPAPAHPGKADA